MSGPVFVEYVVRGEEPPGALSTSVVTVIPAADGPGEPIPGWEERLLERIRRDVARFTGHNVEPVVRLVVCGAHGLNGARCLKQLAHDEQHAGSDRSGRWTRWEGGS